MIKVANLCLTVPILEVLMVLLLPLFQVLTVVSQRLPALSAKLMEAQLELAYVLSWVFA